MDQRFNIRNARHPQDTFSLVGRRVVLTGATGGIGRALTTHLVGAGASLVVVHRGDAGELLDELGDHATGVVCDLADPPAVAAALRSSGITDDTVHGVVNNAGVMTEEPLERLELATWQHAIDVNVTAPLVVVQTLLAALRRAEGASVVNMGSDLARRGGADLAAYTASKAALGGLTRALARELAPGIRVNTVAPGPIRTPLIEPFATDEWVEAKTRQLSLGRLGTPEEVAPVVVYLLSAASSFMTGQTLAPNGGASMA